MRTTISIDDNVLARARETAHARRQTLGQLIEDALRVELANAVDESTPPDLPLFKGGTGPRPGIDLASNRVVSEALDEKTPLDNLR